MKEYEYSFEVINLTPFINYCEENNYNLTNKNKQSRTIYRNANKTMARITIEEKNGITTKKLDFKDDMLLDQDLIERRESLPINFDDEKAVESILEFLHYSKDNTLIRTRYVYEKNNVKFEIDEYEQPRKTFVVAVEGEKTQVDAVYNEIQKLKE